MNKRIVILGAGESGVGAALLSKNKGFDTFVSDLGNVLEKYKKVLNDNAIAYEEGKHSKENIFNADEIIKSPGIPFALPLVQEALKRGIPVIDELEFAYRYSTAKFITITGTNGKTTTALLTYHLLKEAGFNVGLAGNVGASLARQVMESRRDFYVLEVSSFQLEGMKTFRSDIAILLNITPDHLDRYGYELQNYVDAKFRIIQNMNENNHFIFFGGDDIIAKEIKYREILAKLIPVSLDLREKDTVGLVGNKLHFNVGENMEIPLQEVSLKGKHNAINTMAAVTAALLAGADNDKIRGGLKNFKNAAHRLEPVAEINGVSYINDSKATNIDAVWYALDAMEQPLLWIAGGVDKGNDYNALKMLAVKKVKVLICLGKDNEKLKHFFSGILPLVIETDNIQAAVNNAHGLAKVGDAVLLSPACASFDLFKSYEDRGMKFKEAVKTLRS